MKETLKRSFLLICINFNFDCLIIYFTNKTQHTQHFLPTNTENYFQTFTLIRSEIKPVKFTCVYTTPLHLFNKHSYKPKIFRTEQRYLNKKH